jgi:TRAP-type C4-dicarboxylate transport system substrate-binding protein
MQQQLFKEKFGRDPGPGDPVFFDPDEEVPKAFNSEKLDQAVIEALVKSGMDPSYIYAYNKTGLLVTTQNWDKLSPEDQAEWNAAINEAENNREQ